MQVCAECLIPLDDVGDEDHLDEALTVQLGVICRECAGNPPAESRAPAA